ncbi:DUF1016 domain-containing protein [Candidatus Woesearchaeota archaeon]|nr:DUF1016 domain-containing protein [Candidatus Woesearchaeota archaeon]
MKSDLQNYSELLGDLKSLLTKAKNQAYKAVDNILVQTYWQIGERVIREELKHNERADYGKHLIEQLSKDLGFSRPVFYRIVQFYKIYPNILTVSRQLSWSHYQELLMVSKIEEREFYEQQTIQNGWSVRILRQEMKNGLYARISQKGSVIITKRILPLKPIEPENIFKDSYNFNFLDLNTNHNEKEFKDSLLKQLERFLQELGPDFFIGRREVPILISGNYDKIDLELFHAGLLCYVLVEVKTEPFQHKHVSQMYSYLNWYKQNKQQKGQRPPVGLIICKTKDEETVHYALGDLKKEIFIAEYSTKLPSKEKIKELILK